VEGGAGNDVLRVTRLTSSPLDAGYYNTVNTFVGGAGNDRLEGASGTDIYVFNRGDGQDTINDYGWNAWQNNTSYVDPDKVVFGPGIAFTALSAEQVGNNLLLKVNDPSNPGANDQLMIENWWLSQSGTYAYRIESFEFADGTVIPLSNILIGDSNANTLTGSATADLISGAAGNDTLNGNAGDDNISGDAGNDTISGGAGNDVLHGGTGDDAVNGNDGNDVMYGEAGVDILTGGIGNDYLGSGTENDTVDGGEGNDVAQGQGGDDQLQGGAGNDLLAGDEGADTLDGGAGNDFLAGGAGNDAITTGGGTNVVAFNAGGGADTLISSIGASNSLSLGGGIRYEDLALSKDGNDLVVNAGATDKVVLKDWYAGENNLLNLQIILDATSQFDPGSSDPLYNRKVHTFDFIGLANEFDQALAQSPGLTSWALTNALLQHHLAAADDAALGGDISYWYGKNGTLSGIGLQAAQQVIGAPSFGSDAQTLRPFSGLQDGFVKLS
jgi:Ca2+-binding RTX toxin-like protein